MALLTDEPRRGDSDGHGVFGRRWRHERCTGSVSGSVRGSVLPGAKRMRRRRAMEDGDRSMLCNRRSAWNVGGLQHLRWGPKTMRDAGSRELLPLGVRHMVGGDATFLETGFARQAQSLSPGDGQWFSGASEQPRLLARSARKVRCWRPCWGVVLGKKERNPLNISARGASGLEKIPTAPRVVHVFSRWNMETKLQAKSTSQSMPKQEHHHHGHGIPASTCRPPSILSGKPSAGMVEQ